MSKLSGQQKAKILLTLLGEKALGKLARHLPMEHAEKLRDAFKKQETLSQEMVTQVLQEFARFSSLPPASRPQRPAPSSGPGMGDRLAELLKPERPEMIAFVLEKVLPGNVQAVLSKVSEKRSAVEKSLRQMEPVPISQDVQSHLKTFLDQTLAK